jgi:hypothetical protein
MAKTLFFPFLFRFADPIDHRARLEETIRPQNEGSSPETAKFAALEGTNRPLKVEGARQAGRINLSKQRKRPYMAVNPC